MAPIKIAVKGYGVPRETPSERIIVSTIPKGEGSSAAERDCCAGRGKGEEESCCGRHGGRNQFPLPSIAHKSSLLRLKARCNKRFVHVEQTFVNPRRGEPKRWH